jgi:hypothetical protein
MLEINDTLFIRADLSSVFAAFWNPRLWVKLTPHVKVINMFAESDTSQTFQMIVESDGKQHTVETTRHCEKNSWIRYTQIKPPAIFQHHEGEWKFELQDDEAKVSLKHAVEINNDIARNVFNKTDQHEIDKTVRMILLRNGRLTLEAVKAYLENTDVNAY